MRFIITPYTCNTTLTAVPTITTSWKTVAIINSDVTTEGTANLDTSFSVGSCNAKIYDVRVEVGNSYYGLLSISTITVAKSLNDFITGD